MCDLAFSSPSAYKSFGSINDPMSNPSKYAIYLGQTPLGRVATFVSSRSQKEMPTNNYYRLSSGFLLLVPCNILDNDVEAGMQAVGKVSSQRKK
jgi:hypothetical protein